MEQGATGLERKQARADASIKVLDRGELGCLMSPMDMTRAMAALVRMHQSEFEMQVRVDSWHCDTCFVCYGVPPVVMCK